MLIPSEQMINRPVMSLQTGGQLATTKSELIDPRNLTIIAYELEGHQLDQHPSFLTIADIREISNLGIIVDSSEEFIGASDVIKVEEVYGFGFELHGKRVEDNKGHNLGKGIGY